MRIHDLKSIEIFEGIDPDETFVYLPESDDLMLLGQFNSIRGNKPVTKSQLLKEIRDAKCSREQERPMPGQPAHLQAR